MARGGRGRGARAAAGAVLAGLAGLAGLAAAAPELGVEVTHKVECDRSSKNGDTLAMHYTGKLMDGTKVDALSHDPEAPPPLALPLPVFRIPPGYGGRLRVGLFWH